MNYEVASYLSLHIVIFSITNKVTPCGWSTTVHRLDSVRNRFTLYLGKSESRIEVQEVLNATVKMIKKYSEFLDKELVFTFGGSHHGGFFVTHFRG